MVNFNLVFLLSLPFALTSAFAPNPAQTRTSVGHTPSFAFVCKAPKKDTALLAGSDLSDDQIKDLSDDQIKDLSDDQIKSIVARTLLKNDVTDVDADAIFKYIEIPVKEYGTGVSASSSVELYSDVEIQGSCELAKFNFAIEAVSLAMQAVGMPSSAGKKVAKILAKRAQKRLLKEMKKIAKDHFGSPNPVNIAAGLFKILQIIIGDIGFSELLSVVQKNVGIFDFIQIAALLAAYFATGGGALALKLALITPQLIDVVEAAIAVSNDC